MPAQSGIRCAKAARVVMGSVQPSVGPTPAMARAVVRFAKAGSVRRVKVGSVLPAAVVRKAMAAASVAVAAPVAAAMAAAVVRRVASAQLTERPVLASKSSGSPHSGGGSAGPTSHDRWRREVWSLGSP